MSKPKLQGPRPLRKHLTNQIPSSNPPRSAAEALSIGSSRYINRRGRVVGLRQIDNPRRHGPTPLSHTGTETLSSRKGNRGASQRNQSTVQATLQDFKEWGKRNGYTDKQIKDTFQRFQRRNRNQAASVPTGYDNDHTLPHKSAYYQAGENHRNKGILSKEVNNYKTDKMPTPQEMRSLGIPTSMTELIRMEFNDVKPPNPKKVQKLASQIAADPTRIRARDNNTRLDAAKLRYMQQLIDKGLSKSSEPKPKPNSKPRSNLRIAGVLSNNGSGSEIVDHVNEKMHLFAPHLAELGFELL